MALVRAAQYRHPHRLSRRGVAYGNQTTAGKEPARFRRHFDRQARCGVRCEYQIHHLGRCKAYLFQKGIHQKKLASEQEAEIKTKLQTPAFAASFKAQRKQNVKEYLDEWVESYAHLNTRPSTYDGYKRTIKNYIVPYVGHVPLNELSGQKV